MLADEPFCLSYDQIAALTDYQIYMLYLRDRDSKGNVKPYESAKPIYRSVRDPVRERNQYMAMCIEAGQSPQQALKRWESMNVSR